MLSVDYSSDFFFAMHFFVFLQAKKKVMYYPRTIDKYLIEWKESADHKPLLLRGARQVGKSWAVKNLGRQFKYFIEANFEKRKELKSLFERTRNAHDLAAMIGRMYNTPVVAGETLLFLDEIQDCSEAIHSLWSFKEDFPELHVIAAGSLLEFTLKDLHSFGVGRIRSLFMYPMSFDEFLEAQSKTLWLEAKREANPQKPMFDELHQELVGQFRTFLLVGGMPASVAKWVETHDYVLAANEQDDIQQTYYDDFAKYAKKIDPQLLRNTLQSVVSQIGGKFVYSKVQGNASSEEVKKALQMLSDAGVIKRVIHSAGNGLPLGAESNLKFQKYIYLDSGLLLRIMDLELGGAGLLTQQILTDTAAQLVDKGSLTEMVAGWEIVKYSSPRTQNDLYWWENLDRGTVSEVDYLLARNMRVLPVEVKSGISGKMKSLHLFMHNKHLTEAVRCSLENFGELVNQDKADAGVQSRILILPLYAISNLF